MSRQRGPGVFNTSSAGQQATAWLGLVELSVFTTSLSRSLAVVLHGAPQQVNECGASLQRSLTQAGASVLLGTRAAGCLVVAHAVNSQKSSSGRSSGA